MIKTRMITILYHHPSLFNNKYTKSEYDILWFKIFQIKLDKNANIYYSLIENDFHNYIKIYKLYLDYVNRLNFEYICCKIIFNKISYSALILLNNQNQNIYMKNITIFMNLNHSL